MEVARAGRTAGLARDLLERARRRSVGAAPDEERERLDAAFTSTVKLMRAVSKECQNYYCTTSANKCKENEIKHFCKYHGNSIERKLDSTEEVDLMDIKTPAPIQACVELGEGRLTSYGTSQGTEGCVEPCQAQTYQQNPRRPSKDFYIEVSPGLYSVTAISEDVEQTHIVDVNAGQSIDLTFVL